MPKTTKEQFSDYAASRVKAIEMNPLTGRKLSLYADVLAACHNVYDSGIIFPQGGAAAKRLGTPNIDVILENIANRVYEYLSDKTILSMAEFDNLQDSLCSDFLEALNSARRSVGYVEIYYGSAQKFINMVFKYLACYSDFCKYKDHFAWCHMPIDTVILKWLKDEYNIADITYSVYYNKTGKPMLSAKYKKTPWTKFDKARYKELLEIIREKVLNDARFSHLSLLDVEFSIW